MFVAANSRGGSAFLGEYFLVFEQDFDDHFFPATASSEASRHSPREDGVRGVKRYAGSYGMTYGRSESTPEKLVSLMASLTVRTTSDGLSVTMPMGVLDFIETEPLVFRRTDGDAPLVFRENAHGAVHSCFYGSIPLTALVRNRWFEMPGFNLALLAACLLLFMSCIITASVGFGNIRSIDYTDCTDYDVRWWAHPSFFHPRPSAWLKRKDGARASAVWMPQCEPFVLTPYMGSSFFSPLRRRGRCRRNAQNQPR